MKTTRRATPVVVAAVITLGVVGLAGCSEASSPTGPTKAAKTATPTTPTTPTLPTMAAPTTKGPEPGSVPVAGYKPTDVAKAVKFAEQFALAAMSGCGAVSVRGLQHLMTPALYQAALKNPKSWTVLALNPPMVMSQGCVTTQALSSGQINRGRPSRGMPSVQVAVTVTEGLMVGTTTSPTTLKPVTVSRRYTVDVLPSGTGWLATNLETGDTTLTTGK